MPSWAMLGNVIGGKLRPSGGHAEVSRDYVGFGDGHVGLPEATLVSWPSREDVGLCGPHFEVNCDS